LVKKLKIIFFSKTIFVFFSNNFCASFGGTTFFITAAYEVGASHKDEAHKIYITFPSFGSFGSFGGAINI